MAEISPIELKRGKSVNVSLAFAPSDAKPVANVPDEVQFEVHKKDAEEFSFLTRQATKQTEENLSVKCPLDSESKIGLNWSETH